jgi:hypothetical protein
LLLYTLFPGDVQNEEVLLLLRGELGEEVLRLRAVIEHFLLVPLLVGEFEEYALARLLGVWLVQLRTSFSHLGKVLLCVPDPVGLLHLIESLSDKPEFERGLDDPLDSFQVKHVPLDSQRCHGLCLVQAVLVLETQSQVGLQH